ncbi:MAG: TRAP transporter substrate-binding protein [Flavobacteriaceae bacterium]|nr:TRAP transporter substrate-binding protein [Flavobacteriaceae bacterium]
MKSQFYRSTLICSLLFGVVLLFTGCKSDSNVRIIRLGHGLDVTHSVHQAMLQTNFYLNELSQGKMRLQIYPNQQLGSERECLELLQIGSLDMTKVSGAVLENFAPKLRIFGLPFLFDNKDHLFKVLDGTIGKELLKEGEEYWLKGVGFYDSGSRSFYTKERPVEQPEDLEGLKIRVQESVSAFDMVKQLGASPTPISWGELYTALQQGVVDGAENNPPSFYLSRHYEVCKYYSIDEHTMIPDVLLVSTHLWNRLSSEEQGWLQKAIDQSIPYQRDLWIQSENKSLQAVIEAGVEVTYPKKNRFQEATQKMYQDFKKDPQMAELIERIRNEAN